jgi:CO2 hydration protein (ChpXY)
MTFTTPRHPLASYIDRFYNGQSFLPDNADNVKEVVGILDSYGYVIGTYQVNLQHIADREFLLINCSSIYGTIASTLSTPNTA